jgi:hypothetical protein
LRFMIFLIGDGFRSSQVIRNCGHVTPYRRLICSARSWLRCSVIRKNQSPPVLCHRKVDLTSALDVMMHQIRTCSKPCALICCHLGIHKELSPFNLNHKALGLWNRISWHWYYVLWKQRKMKWSTSFILSNFSYCHSLRHRKKTPFTMVTRQTWYCRSITVETVYDWWSPLVSLLLLRNTGRQ